MELFAREKSSLSRIDAERRTIFSAITANNTLFASLPDSKSPEYFLSYLSLEEKKAIQKIALLLSREILKLEKYPKVHSLFAVGSSTYEQEYWQDLAKAAKSIDNAIIIPKKRCEEY
jgi:hypothetical protein